MKSIFFTTLFCLLPLYLFSQSHHPGLSAGTWGGELTTQNQTTEFYLDIRHDENGGFVAVYYLPVIPFPAATIGTINRKDSHYTAGPLQFEINSDRHILTGSFHSSPRGLKFELTPVAGLPAAKEPVSSKSTAQPVWSFATGGPVWGAAAADHKNIYIGSTDGSLYSLSQSAGEKNWAFQTGGPIFSQPLLYNNYVYILSDNGFLYKLDAETGTLNWKFETGGQDWVRKLPNDEKPGYDSMASAPVISNGMVYVGSADGNFIAIDEKSGKENWRFKTGGPVHSIPVIAEGMVYFGSYDHHVYALDAVSGKMNWKFDTGNLVISSPVYSSGMVITGSRSADLFALNALSGQKEWSYYHWGSWVESSGTVHDNLLYIGSSDDQLLKSFNPANGSLLWTADLGGSPWTTPAVTDNTVYTGTFGNANYGIDHRGGFFAVDRLTGKVKWKFMWEKTADTDIYGVVSSPAAANGMVFFGGLDGIVYGFNR